LEQPFPKQLVVMSVAFVHIKTQKVALAHLLSPFQWRLKAQPNCASPKRLTTSDENVENVVSPPRVQPEAQPPAQARTKTGADKDAQERKCGHAGPLKENRCGG
jgi:hypothetical protein